MNPFRCLLLLFASLAVADGHCGVLDDGTIVIPRSGKEVVSQPSPEAASLCRHLEHSIDYSTGRVSIHIPLYSYECGGIAMSVSMSYQTGGIKVDADEGALGVGWDLDYGGYVSRSVVGIPDDTPNKPFISASPATVTKAQLESLHHNNADAMYDRYTYRAGGYNGTFIITERGEIKQLPCTDVKITRTSAGFEIATPDGALYRYDIPERLDYAYHPATMDNTYVCPNYQCTCMWRLSKVLSPSRTDSLVYTYESVDRKVVTASQGTIAASWDSQTRTAKWSHPSAESLVSYSTHTYGDRHRICSISGRAGSIEFSYNAPGKERCTEITVKDPYGVTVRTVSFGSGRKLSHYRIKDSAENILDGADFTYCAGSAQNTGKDFFGYPNGGGDSTAAGYNVDSLNIDNNDAHESIFDKLLRFSWRRQPVLTCTKAESLLGISTMAGTTTIFEYEASDAGCFLTYGRLSPGLRLRSETVTDANTGNVRTRELVYGDPVPSVDFDALATTDFISVSGKHNGATGGTAHYTTGASIAASCRLQGASVENACVYYGTVTETITGTGLEYPVVTEYEYDISQTCTQIVTHVPMQDYSDLWVCGTHRPGDAVLNEPNDRVPNSAYTALLAPHYVRGYFPEQFGDKAPLQRVTRFRRTPSGNMAIWKRTEYHNRFRRENATLGLYSESAVRYLDGQGSTNISPLERTHFTSKYDFNFFDVTCSSVKVFVDSIIEIEYDELGTAHKVTRHFGYNDHPYRRVIGYEDLGPVYSYEDSAYVQLRAPVYLEDPVFEGWREAGNSLLRTEMVECGGQWIRLDHKYSSTSDTEQMRSLDRYNRQSLPVEDRFTTGSGVEYNGCEVSETYSYAVGLHPARMNMTADVIRRRNGNEWITVDSTAVSSHDVYGNPGRVERNGGTPTYYTWCDNGISLGSVTVEGQTTGYGWKPLVGCTYIGMPSGVTKNYMYNGSRLAEVRHAGYKIKTYTYNLHGIGQGSGLRCNAVTEKTVTDASTSQGPDLRRYFDGFGNETGVAHAVEGWNIVYCTLDTYDALGRKTQSYVPGVAYKPQLVPSVGNVYNDEAPYSLITYSHSSDSRPLTATIPGAEYSDHPGHTRHLFNQGHNGGSEGVLNCRRYSSGAEGGDGTVTLAGYYPEGALAVEESTDGDGRRTYTFSDYRGRLILTRSLLEATTLADGYGVTPQVPSGEWTDTYNVYDEAGDLVFVVTPMAAAGMSAVGATWTTGCSGNSVGNPGNAGNPGDNPGTECYSYTYDKRFRPVTKKAPGSDEVRMWHDATGVTILTQDGNQRLRGVCAFAVPDPHGRAALAGECAYSDRLAREITDMHVLASRDYAQDGVMGYTMNITLDGVVVHTANYYDDYTFLAFESFARLDSCLQQHPLPEHRANNLGLLTGTWQKALAPEGYSGTAGSLVSAYCYDERGRLSATATTDITCGLSLVQTTFTNTDKPLAEVFIYRRADGQSERHSYIYTYDGFDRVSNVSMTRGDSTVTLRSNIYNSVGRLSRVTYGNGCVSGYGYKVSGALSGMAVTDPAQHQIFAQNLRYATGDTPSYSGNIGNMDWCGADGIGRRYSYSYDGLNRLVGASYSELGPRPSNYTIGGTRSYSTSYIYGLDSRPLAVTRSGVRSMAFSGDNVALNFGQIDNLTFTYDGSHLVKVYDSADDVVYSGASDFVDSDDNAVEYTYDANGNMISDSNKGIVSIEYNALNLPCKVIFDDGSELVNLYSADGTLLQRRLKESTRQIPHDPFVPLDFGEGNDINGIIGGIIGGPGGGIVFPGLYRLTVEDHIGPLMYRNGTLSRIETPDGFIKNGELYYNIKDYQGNIRQVIDSGGNVVQENHYYPYGMLMAESSEIMDHNRAATVSTMFSINPYLYGGKEYLTIGGANYLDFTARIYDPVTLTFGSQDQMRDDYTSIHSQLYCAANPVMYNDPTGSIIEDVNGLVACYKHYLNEMLTILEGNNNADVKSYIGVVNEALAEIEILENSDQVYRVGLSSGNTGAMYYNADEEKVMIALGSNGNTKSLISHEMKHAYQYETGKISFGLDGFSQGELYDINDEIEAYTRQNIIDNGVRCFDELGYIKEEYKVTKNYVYKKGKESGIKSYKNLPKKELNLRRNADRVYKDNKPINIFRFYKNK